MYEMTPGDMRLHVPNGHITRELPDGWFACTPHGTEEMIRTIGVTMEPDPSTGRKRMICVICKWDMPHMKCSKELHDAHYDQFPRAKDK